MKLFHFLCYGHTTKRAFHPKTTKLYQSCNKKRTGGVWEVRTNGRGKGNKSSIGGSIRQRWSLNGFTALVTGDTRGIGRAVVEELAEFGATVYTFSRNEVALNKCLKEWKEKGFLVCGWVCDASSREQREKLIAEVASATEGKLNVLVNNVGIANVRKPTIEYATEEYSKVMTTNLESTFHLCQLAHSLLKAS